MQPNDMKVYVNVKVVFNKEGQMRPRAFEWEDGRVYKIDRVTEIKQAAAQRCGGQGDRYTIIVQRKERQLYFERSASLTGDNIGRWFIERKQA